MKVYLGSVCRHCNSAPCKLLYKHWPGAFSSPGPKHRVPPSGGTARCRECGMPIRFRDDPLCCLCGGDAWIQCYPTRVGQGGSGMPAYIVPSKRAGLLPALSRQRELVGFFG